MSKALIGPYKQTTITDMDIGVGAALEGEGVRI